VEKLPGEFEATLKCSNITLRTYPKIGKPLFYIQKPQVFEYKKVIFPVQPVFKEA
jgi:hypothetical protein